MQVQVKLPLAGWKHRMSYEDTLGLRETAHLVREPENSHDPDAIAVCAFDDRSRKLGYVPAEHAAIIAPMMDAGHRATATVWTEKRGEFDPEHDGYTVQWAHVRVTVLIEDLPHDAIMELCNIPEVDAAYTVDGDFAPAHRTRSEWKRAGRHVRAGSTAIGFTKKGVTLYSVADLTRPRLVGASAFPGPIR